MLTWVGSCLNCEYVFSIPYQEYKEKAEYKLPKCIDFPKVIELKTNVFESYPKSSKVANLPKQIESVKKLLRKSQVDLIEAAQKMNEKQLLLQEDISQTNQFKIEISDDFNRLKKSLITTESSITIMSAEKEELEEKIKIIKNQFSNKDKELIESREEYDRFLWDILFSLETALCKYESHESTKKILSSMDSGLLQRIKAELENPDKEKTLDRSEKKTGVIKYIGLLAEVLNTFSFEIKSHKQKLLYLEKTEKENQKLVEAIEVERNKFNQEKESIIESKNEESRIKSQEINDMVTNFHNQMNLQRGELEDCRENLRNMGFKINELNSEILVLTNRMQAKAEVISHFRQLTNSLICRVDGLIVQKKCMESLNRFINEANQKNHNFLERVYFKFRDLNLDLDSAELSFTTQQKNEGFKESLTPLQSFRKVILGIIAINRMKRLAQSVVDGFGKYQLEDLNNFEIPDYNDEDESCLNIKNNNPYLDNSEQYMSFAKLHNAAESSISITPDKNDSKNYSIDNMIVRPKSLFTSKTCKSLLSKKNQQIYKRKKKDQSLFPYISIGNEMKLTADASAKSSDRSYNSSASKQYYTALTRQLDFQLKMFLEKSRKTKDSCKSYEKQNQNLLQRINTLEEEIVQSMQKAEMLSHQVNNNCKYNEAMERLREAEKERNYLSQRIIQLEAKVTDLQNLNEEIEEKKVLAKKEAVKANIKLQHLMRDMELKEMCIKSEQEYEKIMKEMREKYEESTSEILSKIKKIEFEKTRLIDDNVKLLNENEKLRQQLLNVTFMKTTFNSNNSVDKENIHENIQNSSHQSSEDCREERRKRTAQFAHIDHGHHHFPSIREVEPHHKKTYSYLDDESSGKKDYDSMPREEESEFEFAMSYHEAEE